MNTLSKIFLCIIIILSGALGFVTYKYITLDKWVKNNMENSLNQEDGSIEALENEELIILE